jgi:DNA segregation ATPase FtsK/SpoIIIE, S-DNA-T family
MATKAKNKNEKVSSKEKTVSSERKKQIIGILLIVASLLIFLSIISYTSIDEANTDVHFRDMFKIVFGPDSALQAKIDKTSNWLGIVGALISSFLIASTIGYFAVIFPLLSGAWGWFIFRKLETKKLLYITNITIIFGLLAAAFIGLIKNISLFSFFGSEWCGSIGAFLASVLMRLFGTMGGLILILTAILIMLIISIDLDLHQTINRIKLWFAALRDWWDNRSSDDEEKISEKPQRMPKVKPIGEKDKEVELKIIRGDDNTEKKTPAFVKAQNEEDSDETIDELPVVRPSKRIQPQQQKLNLSEDTPSEQTSEVPIEDEVIEYTFPPVDLLDTPVTIDKVSDEELKTNADLLQTKLGEFGISIDDISVQPGPVATLYEIIPSSGIKISQITNLADDIQLALKAKGIRIVAPMPGKGTVGVEIVNAKPSMVHLKSIINSVNFRDNKLTLPIALGKTIIGEVFCADLASLPHLLVAGATGSGKSIGINTIIVSLLYKMHPSDIKMVIIDPKKVELSLYEKLKNHYLAVCPDIKDEIIVTSPQNSVIILKSIEMEMDRRYTLLSKCAARNIKEYNDKVLAGKTKDTEEFKHRKLPYIVVLIDELADLMITAAREIEEPIARIAQLARAVGVHLVVATQRPSVDVLTGTIKANFPARMAYQVASRIDSRTILDANGAEQLIGKGDMLLLSSLSPKPMRMQNAFISTEEVERIVDFIGDQKGYSKPYELPSVQEKKRGNGASSGLNDRDELFEEAARLIVRHQQGSVSLIQRRLKVGYSRAARIVDELEMAGIVGPFDGSKARLVLVDTEEDLEAIFDAWT